MDLRKPRPAGGAKGKWDPRLGSVGDALSRLKTGGLSAMLKGSAQGFQQPAEPTLGSKPAAPMMPPKPGVGMRPPKISGGPGFSSGM